MEIEELFLMIAIIFSTGAIVAIAFFAIALSRTYSMASTALRLISEVAEASTTAFKNAESKNTLYEQSLKSCYGLAGELKKEIDKLSGVVSEQDDRVIRSVIEAINRSSN